MLKVAHGLAVYAIAAFLCCSSPAVRAGQQKEKSGEKEREPDSEEPVYQLGSGITPPRVIRQVRPSYSGGSFRRDGTVLVGLVVSSAGLPKKVKVIHGLDDQTDQAAIEAIKEWRFTPARKGDQPVAVSISIELRFHDV